MVSKSCLLFDNDGFARRYMAIMLRRLGYNVVECADIAHARTAVESFKFDLAVIDGMFPDGSGVHFARGLDCPVVFASGAVDEFNRKQMWKLGTVYPKPVDSSFSDCVVRVTGV